MFNRTPKPKPLTFEQTRKLDRIHNLEISAAESWGRSKEYEAKGWYDLATSARKLAMQGLSYSLQMRAENGWGTQDGRAAQDICLCTIAFTSPPEDVT